MRKTFLLGGLALLFASVSVAGQRTRGGDAIRSGARDEVAARPEGSMIAPGVVVTNANGASLTTRMDGVVRLDDILGAYESFEAYEMALALAGVQGMRNGNTNMLANGAQPLLDGYVDPAYLPWTVERHKAQVYSEEMSVGGQTVTLFVDGVVGLETDLRTPQLGRSGCFDMGRSTICVDGSVAFED